MEDGAGRQLLELQLKVEGNSADDTASGSGDDGRRRVSLVGRACLNSLDWTTGLDYWNGLLDS